MSRSPCWGGGGVPGHHGVARPRDANGGDGLQLCRVAVIILNKQTQTADKGWSSDVGLSVELITLHHIK
jgi:hypothetical protein